MVAAFVTEGRFDPRAMVARAAREEALAIARGDRDAFRRWRLNRNMWESRVTPAVVA